MGKAPARIVRVREQVAELEISREIAERAGLRAGDELFAFAPGGDFLLLARDAAKRGFFVGNLEAFSLAEVFGFVCSAIRSGSLVLRSPTTRRRIVFFEGQVVFASSTNHAERLGPVLWRNGMLKLEQLQQCEPKVTAGTKLGKVLVESGFLTPAQLYRGVQLQVREIVLGAFLETRGEFAFIEGEGPPFEQVRLPERTRDLALEGMSRAERVESLRRKMDLAAVPSRTDGAQPPSGLALEAVFGKVDGARSVREVVRASRLGELEALRSLAKLVERGLVRPLPPGASSPKAEPRPGRLSDGPVQVYRLAIRRICEELRAAGVEGRLFSFFATPEGREGIFDGVHLSEQGDLDIDALIENSHRLYEGAVARARVLEALDGFVVFALFDARNVLPRDTALELGREVGLMLRGRLQ
ncbi:MAG: DUF4388 domain-containing protein [Myxococcales bacterium]|jgi:hypothetical protein